MPSCSQLAMVLVVKLLMGCTTQSLCKLIELFDFISIGFAANSELIVANVKMLLSIFVMIIAPFKTL